MPGTSFVTAFAVIAGAGVLAVSACTVAQSQSASNVPSDSYLANDRTPDLRLKVDILVVVAHPDDEILASAYLARAINDEHKRVAVVYGTHGDGGNNEIGPEQALAMGQIREFEARQVGNNLGVTSVWFLTGRDTASQNVLNSLEHWGHGACLDHLIRIVRLTQPSVILTFLPDFTTGENHSDHQAAGVLATEAFDLADSISRAGISRHQSGQEYESYRRSAPLAAGEDLLLLQPHPRYLYRAGAALLIEGDISVTPS